MRYLSVLAAAFMCSSLCPLNTGLAKESATIEVWKCLPLLDKQTKSALADREKLFTGLFRLPREYQLGSEEKKTQLITQWLNDIQSGNQQKIMEAAAYLGIVKAAEAAEPVEKLLTSGKCAGRLLWVCARSLGQTGDKNSVPILINLLDSSQKDASVYARVSLAEITGVYFGSDKEKWQAWLSNEAQDSSALRLDEEIADFGNQAPMSGALGSNADAVKKLRRIIDEKYSYRDLRGINWDALFKQYGARMENAKSPSEFAQVAAEMLSHTKDPHIYVKLDGRTVGGCKRTVFCNYNTQLLRKSVSSWHRYNDRVSSGRISTNIGYILINSWSKENSETLDAAFIALKELSGCRGLIIDVRPNGGGSEPLAAEFAGCFVDTPALYAKHTYRDVDEPNGWTPIQERILRPNPDQPKYHGRVVVLIGQANLSSCEAFILMMKQVPGCILIGNTSGGSSGNPKPCDLGNLVTVWLPSWKALRPDGTCFETEGIKPDIFVSTTQAKLRTRDEVLETAITYLRNKR